MHEGYVKVEADFMVALPHVLHGLGIVLKGAVPLYKAEALLEDALRNSPQAGRMSERQRLIVWDLCTAVLQDYCKPE